MSKRRDAHTADKGVEISVQFATGSTSDRFNDMGIVPW
jgi:hypothetical protein